KIAVVMEQVGVAEAHVQPRRIQRRGARNRSFQFRKKRIQILQRPQVQRRYVDVEGMERCERGKQNVELALAARFRHCAGNMRVVEDQRRLLDLEMIEWSAG